MQAQVHHLWRISLALFGVSVTLPPFLAQGNLGHDTISTLLPHAPFIVDAFFQTVARDAPASLCLRANLVDSDTRQNFHLSKINLQSQALLYGTEGLQNMS